MLIATIVGTRPQFIKSAPVSKAIASLADGASGVKEWLIHTGQHYDPQMSDVFFSEFGLDGKRTMLSIGSGHHGEQTSRCMIELEKLFLDKRPDVVLVYGDCNSTLAGALVAAKMNIPVAHVEAGLRSRNIAMPEEINRIGTDVISELLFAPTQGAMDNLVAENLADRSYLVGDVMYDLVTELGKVIEHKRRETLERYKLTNDQFVLATLHRAENTDNRDRLAGVLDALNQIAQEVDVVIPMHPRTVRKIEEYALEKSLTGFKVVQPLPYLETAALIKSATTVLTDSGGLQKEAYFHETPCITLRDETEWTETLSEGANVLVGTDAPRIVDAWQMALSNDFDWVGMPKLFGDGSASQKIANIIVEKFG